MNEAQRIQLLKAKSAVPTSPMATSIESLLHCTDLAISQKTIVKLAETIATDLRAGYQQLITIDQEIGGVGLHNIHRRNGEYFTGNYRVEFRPLFRPIQYVFAWVTDEDLVWNARRIVQDSCLHIENAVKYRFDIPEEEHASLGVLLDKRIVKTELESSFLALLRNLNRVVYRTAKHSVEDIRIDAHRFTPADSLAVYLICRWAGVRLLEPTGIFNAWQRPT